MPLTPGMQLGPYEIIAPLGSGGMGEVYRARDHRLSRDVAVKILPPSVASDAERLHRFQQEARATGQLNHPNILAVYDLGEHEGTPYVVEELLEGETLRQRLNSVGALAVRKALDWARQITEGLAAAHEKGIIHRDLKPENIFLTLDGRVKILDFGLAKLTAPDAVEAGFTGAPTKVETGTGVVMGSAGYMSPEQVRGEAVDVRSDIFSFGAVLHEMLTGKRAFQADSAVETMNAILKSNPPSVLRVREGVPELLEAMIQRCLEKSPGERFHSASDLAFQLQTVLGTETRSAPHNLGASPRRGPRLNRVAVASLATLFLIVGAAAFMAGKRSVPVRPLPSYHQLTFRQGPIPSARFMADGQTVVYSAAWNGGLTEVYSTQVATPGSRPLAIPDAEILSVSPMGELAVLLNSRFTMGWMRNGILARLAPSGGTPRQVAENVMHATWDAEGKELALVREVQGRYRLEYPIGRVIYETNGWIDSLRFSPTEPWSLAFIHHPMRGDSRGEIVVVSLEGTASVLTQEFSSAAGLAWTPGGREIWFSATETSGTKAIYAVSLNSRLRLVDQAPADMHLHDISLSGEVLLSRDSQRRGIFARAADADAETELSFLDWSRPGDLSRDGRWLLFEEQGQGGTSAYTVLLRDTEGKPPVTLGRGVSCSLSPDARWALTVSIQEPRRFTLMPTGAGEARHLNLGDLNIFHGAIHPDGKRLVVEGAKPGEASRLWIWTLDTEELHPLSPPGATFPYLIPETGEYVLATGSDGAPWIYPVDSGAPFPAPGTTAEDTPVGVSDDGTSIYVALRGTVPRTVERVELESGSRHEHLVLAPRDRTGLLGVDFIQMAADGQAYAYSFRRRLSTLYVVRGLLEGPGR